MFCVLRARRRDGVQTNTSGSAYVPCRHVCFSYFCAQTEKKTHQNIANQIGHFQPGRCCSLLLVVALTLMALRVVALRKSATPRTSIKGQLLLRRPAKEGRRLFFCSANDCLYSLSQSAVGDRNDLFSISSSCAGHHQTATRESLEKR